MLVRKQCLLQLTNNCQDWHYERARSRVQLWKNITVLDTEQMRIIESNTPGQASIRLSPPVQCLAIAPVCGQDLSAFLNTLIVLTQIETATANV